MIHSVICFFILLSTSFKVVVGEEECISEFSALRTLINNIEEPDDYLFEICPNTSLISGSEWSDIELKNLPDSSTLTIRCGSQGNIDDNCEYVSADNDVMYMFHIGISEGLHITFEGIQFRSGKTEIPGTQEGLFYMYSSCPPDGIPKMIVTFRNCHMTGGNLDRVGVIKATGCIDLRIVGGKMHNFRNFISDKWNAFGYLITAEKGSLLTVDGLQIDTVKTGRLFNFESNATIQNICVLGLSSADRTFYGSTSNSVFVGGNNYFEDDYEDNFCDCNVPGYRLCSLTESYSLACLVSGTEVDMCSSYDSMDGTMPTLGPSTLSPTTQQPISSPTSSPTTEQPTSKPTSLPTPPPMVDIVQTQNPTPPPSSIAAGNTNPTVSNPPSIPTPLPTISDTTTNSNTSGSSTNALGGPVVGGMLFTLMMIILGTVVLVWSL